MQGVRVVRTVVRATVPRARPWDCVGAPLATLPRAGQPCVPTGIALGRSPHCPDAGSRPTRRRPLSRHGAGQDDCHRAPVAGVSRRRSAGSGHLLRRFAGARVWRARARGSNAGGGMLVCWLHAHGGRPPAVASRRGGGRCVSGQVLVVVRAGAGAGVSGQVLVVVKAGAGAGVGLLLEAGLPRLLLLAEHPTKLCKKKPKLKV